MSANSKIEWTDRTWNPVRGCRRISPGCEHCYAELLAARFSKPGQWGHGFAEMTLSGPRWTGKLALIPEKLDEPLRWRKPSRVFVNSMSDLFHESLPDDEIGRVFGVMGASRQHTFQILTKRSERMRRFMSLYSGDGGPLCRVRASLPHVLLGVSVENRAALTRLDDLRRTPAARRFVSLEPLLEDLGEINLAGIHWVIVGGESGPGARPFDVAWARSTVEQCRKAGVACFVKQLGAHPYISGATPQPNRWPEGIHSSTLGPVPDAYNLLGFASKKGGDPEEWPEDLRVREFPT